MFNWCIIQHCMLTIPPTWKPIFTQNGVQLGLFIIKNQKNNGAYFFFQFHKHFFQVLICFFNVSFFEFSAC